MRRVLMVFVGIAVLSLSVFAAHHTTVRCLSVTLGFRAIFSSPCYNTILGCLHVPFRVAGRKSYCKTQAIPYFATRSKGDIERQDGQRRTEE